MKTRIFVSYARPDREAAIGLCQGLVKRGYTPWRDEESLVPGQEWEEEIERAIKEAHFVVLLLSANSTDHRGFFQREIRLALATLQTVPSGHIYLIPARLDDCRIPEPVECLHRVDLFPDWDGGIDRICGAVQLQNRIREEIALRERNVGSEPQSGPTILLVNDEPAAMNAVVDNWRLAGLQIDYAFDVDQAIRKIEQDEPDVIMSDMSHFVYESRTTDRAAFEILEWARRAGRKIKLVITCAEITAERRQTASELGAVGICNNVSDLNRLLLEALGTAVRSQLARSLRRSEESQDARGIASIRYVRGTSYRSRDPASGDGELQK